MFYSLLDFVWPHYERQIGGSRETFLDFVLWHWAKGYMTLCIEDGEPTGCCFWWRLDSIEGMDSEETMPIFRDCSETGDYLFCAYGVGEVKMLPQMIKGAVERFPGVKYFCYQRSIRDDFRIRIRRL